MIDSARHYLSVASILKLIKSMPLSKLNVLHWHIVDDESFPLELVTHPELAQYSRYSKSEVYTAEDVKQILNAASLNAVQVVPEIDTPAHVRAWGQAPVWKALGASIACAGGTGYNGQFDVSIPQVFDLAMDVIKEVNQMFSSSPYIHLGGD
jgi:hexosaminidase